MRLLVVPEGVDARDLRLSIRHRQILALIAEGLSDKEIATRLCLSAATIKTYLGRIYRTNGFKNRAQAAAAYANSGTRLLDASPFR